MALISDPVPESNPACFTKLYLDPEPNLITDPDIQIISDTTGSGSTTLGISYFNN
jgi:hypothetical protein